MMRTTLTLEPDVAAELERLRKRDKAGWKALVNEILRIGLRHRGEGERPGAFRTEPVDLGLPRLEIDDVSEALAVAEGEAFR